MEVQPLIVRLYQRELRQLECWADFARPEPASHGKATAPVEDVLLQHLGVRELLHSQVVDQDARLGLRARAHETLAGQDVDTRAMRSQLALLQQVQEGAAGIARGWPGAWPPRRWAWLAA